MNRSELRWYELPVPATRTIGCIATEVRLGPEDGMPSECADALDDLPAIGPVMRAGVCARARTGRATLSEAP
jgi:hypothetical protein